MRFLHDQTHTNSNSLTLRVCEDVVRAYRLCVWLRADHLYETAPGCKTVWLAALAIL